MSTDENDVRPPVDPMSDVSWARVERGLWARLDGTATTQIAAPPSRRWLWIALPSVAVAAAIAIVFGVVIDTPKPLPSVPVVEAPVVEETPTRVVSGESPSTITVGDAHVTLDADSAVVMPRTSDSTAVLERGAAWFAIAPRTKRQFIVVAGDTVVRVIGTKFRVARSEEHATVEVERGLVDVTFQGTTVKVTAGQRWSSEAPSKVASRETKTARIVEPKRTAGETPKPEPKATTRTPIVDDERAKFERFQAIEARDPAAALAGYLEISRGTSRWAENSLYAAARLSADRGEARAEILLDMYLRRYPRGANADDARQLLDRLKGAP